MEDNVSCLPRSYDGCGHLNHIVFWDCFWQKLMFFDQMEDNVSWPPYSKDCFGIWKHFLNPIWVTEALNRINLLNNIVYWGRFWPKLIAFWPDGRWKMWVDRHIPTIVLRHIMNHIWVTEALNRPQKRSNMVLILVSFLKEIVCILYKPRLQVKPSILCSTLLGL